MLAFLRLLRDYGFSIVRDVPTEIDAVVALAERIAFVQESNFGRSFHVISKPDPENLAYTAHKLNAHTDVVNRHSAVNLQLLHCLEFEAQGGESILVDGFEAARRLREEDPAAYRLLSLVEVPFRFQDGSVDIMNHSRILNHDGDGRLVEVRMNTALMAPLDIDPHLIVDFYAAISKFVRILRRPELEYVFKMRPGDCQVFDNQRVLHARAAFDPNSGPRRLQGCYVDKDDFRGRLAVLERMGADFRKS
jgi:gamma-butyrobetaine dioxygenase